jgi:hypothetical protein
VARRVEMLRRARNPKSACRVKQTGKVPRGESRHEGEKPWRWKCRGCGKPAAGVQLAVSNRLRPVPRKGLVVLMALKGKRTSGEASPGERVAGRSRDARYRKAPPVTTAPQEAALSGAATAVRMASSGEAESL